MTHLGLITSHYINGVSMRHEEISQNMFPDYPINSVTNGVHAVTWTSEPFCALYDLHIPEWRHDNLYLRYAIGIPPDEIRNAHYEAKKNLIKMVEDKTGVKLSTEAFTLGFARRSTAYKRAELLFSDSERLKNMAKESGTIQILYAGKAHPHDQSGKDIIRSIYRAARDLSDSISVVYLENHDMALAKKVCSGVDLWLNTPQRPHEASGTSGMKASLNGVPSLSVLDGWWIEGHIEGVTGWSVGETVTGESDNQAEAESLYRKLQHKIIPLFYQSPDDYALVMRTAISVNGSFYNAQRMLLQYLANAYSRH
jgi:starch phosphorylase